MRQFSSRVSGFFSLSSEPGRRYAFFQAAMGAVLNAALAANLSRLLSLLSLLQHCDDWRLGESASSHGRLLTGCSCQKTPLIICLLNGEAYELENPMLIQASLLETRVTCLNKRIILM